MFPLFLLAGLLPLSRIHALFPPGPISLVVSLLVVALFWTYIVRQLILPLVFGRDVVLRNVDKRLLVLFSLFFLLQYGARVLPSAKVMAYSYLTPSWVILWEIALGHGLPPTLILVGIGLTVVAWGMLLRDEDAVKMRARTAHPRQ